MKYDCQSQTGECCRTSNERYKCTLVIKLGCWKTRPMNIILHCLSLFKLMIDKAVLFIISFIPNLLRCVFSQSIISGPQSVPEGKSLMEVFSPRLDHREDIKQSCSCPKHTHLSYQGLSSDLWLHFIWPSWFLAHTECSSTPRGSTERQPGEKW